MLYQSDVMEFLSFRRRITCEIPPDYPQHHLAFKSRKSTQT